MRCGFGKILKKAAAVAMLAVIIAGMFLSPVLSISARAEEWPYPGGDINAEGAVVMDADTMAVLWGRNQDVQYYPASITKLMTALIVLEHCGLSEKVPITANAVYGLERGATTAGLSVDDILTVEDLLYALLLRSANDAANALAIYTAGSIDDFAVMMTEKAAELGCKNTVFKNPSGLTDREHLTTPYDMALILKACMDNADFMEIESHDSYKLSPTQKYPDGLTVTMGHKMLRDGTSYSDDRVTAGKTGFTSASGNTLVTAAEADGRRVIAVIMKGKNPYHYSDTKKLIDFGLGDFTNINVEDAAKRFGIEERLKADKIITGNANNIVIYGGSAEATVPLNGSADELTASYDYNLGDDAPDMSVALLKLYFGERNVGSAYVLNEKESSVGLDEFDLSTGTKAVGIGVIIIAAAACLFVFSGSALKYKSVSDERKRRKKFEERRRARLKAMGISDKEFERTLRREKNRRYRRR